MNVRDMVRVATIRGYYLYSNHVGHSADKKAQMKTATPIRADQVAVLLWEYNRRVRWMEPILPTS